MSSSTTIQTAEDNSDKEICKFCRRQFAKYTCPTCNVPYCSLTCFRSEAHADCSESFYKKEIEVGIHAEPSKTAEERSKMLELLKRFEEQSVTADENLNAEDEDDGVSDLAKRFSSVDINTTSSDILWSMLAPQEKEKFMKALSNPSGELAQQLLSSEELEKEIWDPWWEAPTLAADTAESTSLRSRYGDPPSIMHVPSAMLKPVPNRPLLVYNLCSICISYAYIIRHLGVSSLSSISLEDPNYDEALRLVAQLVAFLVDRKATLVYPNLSSLVTDLWSRFDQDAISPDLFSLLLQDASHLMNPLRITHTTDPSSPQSDSISSHPHRFPILVLSDLSQLFEVGVGTGRIPKDVKHVVHKLIFYAAHVLTMPTPILRAVMGELMEKAVEYQSEDKWQKGGLGSERVKSAPEKLVQELQLHS